MAQAVQRTLAQLLPGLHECPGDESRWSAYLDELGSVFRARSVVLQWLEPRDSRLRSSWFRRDSVSESDRERHEAYLGDSANPRLQSMRPLEDSGPTVVRDRDLFADNRVALADIQERLRALDLGEFLGGGIPGLGRNLCTLALHRMRDDRRAFSARDEALLRALLPHLRNAMALHLRVTQAESRRQTLEGVLDHLRSGILLCDATSGINWANAAALEILARSGLAWSNPNGTGIRSMPVDDCLRHLANGRGLKFLALRVGLPGQRIVLLSDGISAPSLPIGLVATQFGLTPVEAELTVALCKGRSLRDYAATRGVSIGTARFQLKQVLRKAQCPRQSVLVGYVLSSLASQLREPGGSSPEWEMRGR